MIGGEPERTLKVAILGAGRMGRELIAAIAAGPDDVRLVSVWARHPDRLVEAVPGPGRASLETALVSDDLEAVLEPADVTIDFTLPPATPAVLDAVGRLDRPLVCGVSGLDDALLRRMREAAGSVPVFYDRNMSFGIAVLADLVARAGAVLGPEFVAEVHETHHVHKRDAPSGTALKLGEALAAARWQDFGRVYRYAERMPAARQAPDDIVFLVTREGENPGEHSVLLRSGSETLELSHRVKDRRVFAVGALRAAKWLMRQPPGFYQMRDLAGDPALASSARGAENPRGR